MEEYDYSEPGAYFITICTNKRGPRFGTITNNEVNLNETGIIARQLWREIPEHFENVELGEFILMPNHLHGIIIINEERINNKGVTLNDGRGTAPTKNFGGFLNDGRGPACRAPTEELGDSPRGDGPNSFRGSRVPTEEMKSSRIERRGPTIEGKFPRLEGFQKPVPGSIPTIIRSYKSALTREIHRFIGSNEPVWQRGYYEHVIRNEKEWGMIHDYIAANPVNWDQDQIGKREWMQRKIR